MRLWAAAGWLWLRDFADLGKGRFHMSGAQPTSAGIMGLPWLPSACSLIVQPRPVLMAEESGQSRNATSPDALVRNSDSISSTAFFWPAQSLEVDK